MAQKIEVRVPHPLRWLRFFCAALLGVELPSTTSLMADDGYGMRLGCDEEYDGWMDEVWPKDWEEGMEI